jgi:DNA-binding response OmpR family regulator
MAKPRCSCGKLALCPGAFTGAARKGTTTIRILLIEDDAELAQRLAEALTAAGFSVDHAADGDSGWYMGDTGSYDAAVLDLGLPRLPGLEVLSRWRAAGRDMPVLILSARGTWSERVEGLNAGADDYMSKPFHVTEVIARLRSLLRRATGGTGAVLRHGGISLNIGAGRASVDGQDVELTARELKILGYLMHRTGRIVSQADLTEYVYALEDTRDSNTIEVYIARLRKKLGRDAIRTVRGLGYRMG